MTSMTGERVLEPLAAATLPSISPTTLPTTFPTTMPSMDVGAAQVSVELVVWLGLLALGIYIGRRVATPGWSTPRCLRPQDAMPLWFGGGLMIWCFLAVPTVVLLLLRPAGENPPPPGPGIQVLITSTTYAAGLAAVVMVHWLWKGTGSPATLLGLNARHPKRLRIQFIAAVLIALPLTYLVAAFTTLAWRLVGFQHEPAHPMLQLMGGTTTPDWVVAAAMINAIVLAPLYEEVLFRGHLQTALTGLTRSRWPAIIITSAMFAIIHPAWTIPPIFALSLIIGFIYERTGNLWIAIATHVAFNAVSTAVYLVAH
jgi:membrane protease YdiL (CAAX protease family)